MSAADAYKIRPAGRHILTIGRDLIQDSYAAVVELVKNSYDADSPDVSIHFAGAPSYSIVVEDHGHGMSRDTVINSWMVPSTRDKLDRRTSPKGRSMQGRKGVGRYAASILGKDLLLETTTVEGERTTVFVEWDDFQEAQFLDDVELLIETTRVSDAAGTRLTITGSGEHFNEWDQSQFDRLRFELKKLISPVAAAVSKDEFVMRLSISGFPAVQDVEETVEPYPIFDLFDYKIAGRIAADGMGNLVYSLQKIRSIPDEDIAFDNGGPTGCGELVFDIRVYDREKEAIESLIGRGLTDEFGNYVGKLQARRLLNDYNGIGVYRGGFRIRPLGDADFDWLKLNERRVQNPSLRIGSNQVIGFVQIQSDEQSGLIEKSARDGLKDNAAYGRLKKITRTVIARLEERRFDYRRRADLNKRSTTVDRELTKLFSSDELKRVISRQLTQGGVDRSTVARIVEIIGKDEEDKNRAAEEIRQTVAIYQGQATLGKIINVILHEGRRPLNYFRNQIPNLMYWYGSYLETHDADTLPKIIPVIEGIGQNAEFIVNLFDRLDPLAATKRSSRAQIRLKATIEKTLSVFHEELRTNRIRIHVFGPDEFQLSAWPQDIYAIFTNLVDNSIYWMKEGQFTRREISIEIVTDRQSLLHVDYRDTGPGIDATLIASEVIFEPQFSTKVAGTGLGLAIAGEAAHRSELELKAFDSDSGAWFRLQQKTEDD